jgi:hypothetical protein
MRRWTDGRGRARVYRTQPQRRSTPWTRLTGMLLMVASYATVIVGVLPLPPDADVRDLRLALISCTLVCVLMWITASVRSPRTDAVALDKAGQRERRPARSLPILLGLAIPLASGAALVQAVGPDGEQGRWVSQVYAADGGAYEIPIDTVLSEPHPTGVNINDVDEYAADVTVTSAVRRRRPHRHRPRCDDGRQAGRGRHGSGRVRAQPPRSGRASQRQRVLLQRLCTHLDLGPDLLLVRLRCWHLRDERP